MLLLFIICKYSVYFHTSLVQVGSSLVTMRITGEFYRYTGLYSTYINKVRAPIVGEVIEIEGLAGNEYLAAEGIPSGEVGIRGFDNSET